MHLKPRQTRIPDVFDMKLTKTAGGLKHSERERDRREKNQVHLAAAFKSNRMPCDCMLETPKYRYCVAYAIATQIRCVCVFVHYAHALCMYICFAVQKQVERIQFCISIQKRGAVVLLAAGGRGPFARAFRFVD